MKHLSATIKNLGAFLRSKNAPSLSDCELVEVRRSTAVLLHQAAARLALSQRPPCRPSCRFWSLLKCGGVPPHFNTTALRAVPPPSGIPAATAAFLALLLFAAGCASNDSGDPSGALTGGFVAVTGISRLPVAAEVNEPVPLTAGVEPAAATNKTVVWHLNSAGTTGAKLAGGEIIFAAAGEASLTARIPNGLAEGEPYTQNFTITVTDPYDLKTVFAVTETEADGVTATFTKVSEYLRDTSEEQIVQDGRIRLGSYIDLDALYVPTYTNGDYSVQFCDLFDRHIDETNLFKGRLLRLIVVGINSFYPERGAAEYEGGFGESTPVPHLVFMFQNAPAISRWGETSEPYSSSVVRKYLVPVQSAAGSGKFLEALIESGIPAGLFFAPKRYIAIRSSNPTGVELVVDKLWLPTMREMFGFDDTGDSSDISARPNDVENKQNQARLAYYNTDESRKKYSSQNSLSSYYTASPRHGDTTRICEVSSSGKVTPSGSSRHEGPISPAFCIKAAAP